MAEPFPGLSDGDRAALLRLLAESKKRGFLGPGLIESHIDHALNFAQGDRPAPVRVLDLGSGGGVPGLVLALVWPAAHFALLDSMAKRCRFLREAAASLSRVGSVEILEGRAEEFGAELPHRGSFDLVVARSFGPPGVVAECAAGFLKVGGRLVVSEPPGEVDRWRSGALEQLGLVSEGSKASAAGVMRQAFPCPAQFPRKSGVPAKRPLF